MSRWSRSMSPVALALSILALVVATSAGTAYAAVKIGTKQLKNGAVTSAKIKDGGVKSLDIGDGAVTTADVLNGTLGLADLSAAARTSLTAVRAFATVDVNGGGTPSLVTSATRGIVGVERTSLGTYCLTPAPALALDVSKAFVMVGAEWAYSQSGELEPSWDSEPCSGNRIKVITEQAGTASDVVAFTVLVF